MARRDQRSEQAQAYRALYRTARWKRTRADQLAKQPLCETCLGQKRTTAATICDHIDPKDKLDPELFFTGKKQSLCDQDPWRCHSRQKQIEERREAAGRLPLQACGADGWPL